MLPKKSGRWYHSPKGFSRKEIETHRCVVVTHSTKGRLFGPVWIDASSFGFEEEIRRESWKDALEWIKNNINQK